MAKWLNRYFESKGAEKSVRNRPAPLICLSSLICSAIVGNPNPKRLFVNKKEIELKQTLQQAVLLDAFALAVKNNEKAFKTPGEMGLRDIRIVEKIYESVAKAGAQVPM